MPFRLRLLPGFPTLRIFLACSLLPLAAAAQERPKLDVPYIPTPPSVVARILDFGKVGPDDFVIDLGSGDGRIPIAAAKERGARAFGVDIDPVRVRESEQNARKAGVADRVAFKTQDLFDTDLSKASVLTMYLFPEINMKLRPHLLTQLKPGTRVVSHAFHMEDWTPDLHEVVDGRDVFLWLVPAPVEGLWRVESPSGETFVLRFWQQFQRIQGMAMYQQEHSVPLTHASLSGTHISFAIETADGRRTFSGDVDGKEMHSGDDDKARWRAYRF